MRDRADHLFAKNDLRGVLEAHDRKMLNEIEGIEANRILNTSADDLCDYFETQYKVDVPRVKQDQISLEQGEAKVDVSQDPFRVIFDRSQPFYLTGTQVKFFIPFEGDEQLFKCQPSVFGLSYPFGSIVGNEIVLTYTRTDHDATAVKNGFDRDLGQIQQTLERIQNDVLPFNNLLRSKAKTHIEARRSKLLKDQGLAAALGFPLRKRGGAPQTYVVPTVRRKAPVSKPSGSSAPYVPEPTLDMQEYEHILSVILNMVAVMERSPAAFHGMKEEDLRQHFLVQLNGQYEGQATGETFNFEGKTDILIRVEGKNIFIAECKFWRGPESFREALDQLLGYATWRDGKLALLIFNRDRQFSAVLAKIPDLVKAHLNFKRQVDYRSESGFRFVLHHRDDQNRELILTVLAFEVPA